MNLLYLYQPFAALKNRSGVWCVFKLWGKGIIPIFWRRGRRTGTRFPPGFPPHYLLRRLPAAELPGTPGTPGAARSPGRPPRSPGNPGRRRRSRPSGGSRWGRRVPRGPSPWPRGRASCRRWARGRGSGRGLLPRRLRRRCSEDRPVSRVRSEESERKTVGKSVLFTNEFPSCEEKGFFSLSRC